MRIIEQHCQGKRTDQSLNEDGLIITDDFAAVVDGATSKSVHHLAGLVLGRVQHRREACGPFAHRTAGEHVVAAHAHDQHIRPVIDIADHPVAHTSSGRAELADRTPGHRPTGTLATRAASSGIMPFDWPSTPHPATNESPTMTARIGFTPFAPFQSGPIGALISTTRPLASNKPNRLPFGSDANFTRPLAHIPSIGATAASNHTQDSHATQHSPPSSTSLAASSNPYSKTR